jgi:rRNA-processing protein FCF1
MRPVVFFEADETADDQIARAAAELDEPYWLVTSDRELRERAGRAAERVIGGGTFVRKLSAARGLRP